MLFNNLIWEYFSILYFGIFIGFLNSVVIITPFLIYRFLKNIILKN